SKPSISGAVCRATLVPGGRVAPPAGSPSIPPSRHRTRRSAMSVAVPVQHRQLFIDGQWCESASGKKLAVENPATEETIAEVSFGGKADCARAVAAASEAMKGWMKL